MNSLLIPAADGRVWAGIPLNMSDISGDNKLVINDELVIPLGELRFRFAASGGPGGQHVNKTETKVMLSFSITQSPSLNEAQRARLLAKLASRLDGEGVLTVTAQIERSQQQNREAAMTRLQQLLAEALKIPKRRRPTKPSLAAQERRQEAKRRRGERKKERGRDWRRDDG